MIFIFFYVLFSTFQHFNNRHIIFSKRAQPHMLGAMNYSWGYYIIIARRAAPKRLPRGGCSGRLRLWQRAPCILSALCKGRWEDIYLPPCPSFFPRDAAACLSEALKLRRSLPSLMTSLMIGPDTRQEKKRKFPFECVCVSWVYAPRQTWVWSCGELL